MNEWFKVDKEGLRKILERRGKQFATKINNQFPKRLPIK